MKVKEKRKTCFENIFFSTVQLSQDLDDNPPIITADLTTLTIKETDSLNDLIGISVVDIDKDYTNSRYTLDLM